MRVYLDTCVWCRPFDQPSPRVNREALALRRILREADRGRLTLVGSPVLEMETEWLGNREKGEAAHKLIGKSVSEQAPRVPAGTWSTQRRLRAIGLMPVDSLHLAWAASVRCDVFITTDDGILKMAGEVEKTLGLRVLSPVDFVRGL